MSRRPTTDGLDVVDSTGVVTGNADLHGEGTYTGTPATADGSKAPLPLIYPLPEDLPDPKREALIDTAGIVAVAGLCFALGGWLL